MSPLHIPSFGQHLRELRLEKGTPLQDLASYIDTDPAYLSKIERGQVNATKAHVFLLASYFDVEVKDMLIRYQNGRILSETKGDLLSKGTGAINTATSNLINNMVAASKRYQNMMHTLSQLRESRIQIRHHKPSDPLSSYMESILYCQGHHLAYPFEKILPDGVVQLIIKLDNHERLLQNGEKPSDSLKNAWICGIQKQSLTYQLRPSETILYVRFHPGGFYALTGIPQSEIENTTLEADLLLGPSVLRLREEILHCTTVSEVFRKVEDYFRAKISQPKVEHAVVSFLCAHIHDPIALLVGKTGYSQKHLIHLFKKHIGVTPKYFQRIKRFNSVLNQMQAVRGPVDWATIAFDHHYYDQAHFIKEFRHFSGMSPQAYLEDGSTCAKVMHSHTGR